MARMAMESYGTSNMRACSSGVIGGMEGVDMVTFFTRVATEANFERLTSEGPLPDTDACISASSAWSAMSFLYLQGGREEVESTLLAKKTSAGC